MRSKQTTTINKAQHYIDTEEVAKMKIPSKFSMWWTVRYVHTGYVHMMYWRVGTFQKWEFPDKIFTDAGLLCRTRTQLCLICGFYFHGCYDYQEVRHNFVPWYTVYGMYTLDMYPRYAHTVYVCTCTHSILMYMFTWDITCGVCPEDSFNSVHSEIELDRVDTVYLRPHVSLEVHISRNSGINMKRTRLAHSTHKKSWWESRFLFLGGINRLYGVLHWTVNQPPSHSAHSTLFQSCHTARWAQNSSALMMPPVTSSLYSWWRAGSLDNKRLFSSKSADGLARNCGRSFCKSSFALVRSDIASSPQKWKFVDVPSCKMSWSWTLAAESGLIRWVFICE